tara:strand:+ start:10081 stop:10299 length:219 start_codon:yes stop_codon:yes gene_type:complete
MEARLEALEKEMKELKMGKPVGKKEKKTRAPSAYNEYMKVELSNIKASHPDMPHKERFKLAASRYGEKKSHE